MSTRNDAGFVRWCDILDENVAFRQSQWPRTRTQVRGFFTLDGQEIQSAGQRVRHGISHPKSLARARLPSRAGDDPRLLAAGAHLGSPWDGFAAPRKSKADPLAAQLSPVRGARDHFLTHVAALRHGDRLRKDQLRRDSILVQVDSLVRDPGPDPPRLEGVWIDGWRKERGRRLRGRQQERERLGADGLGTLDLRRDGLGQRIALRTGHAEESHRVVGHLDFPVLHDPEALEVWLQRGARTGVGDEDRGLGIRSGEDPGERDGTALLGKEERSRSGAGSGQGFEFLGGGALEEFAGVGAGQREHGPIREIHDRRRVPEGPVFLEEPLDRCGRTRHAVTIAHPKFLLRDVQIYRRLTIHDLMARSHVSGGVMTERVRLMKRPASGKARRAPGKADEEVAALAWGLAHPARAAILRMLLDRGECICGAIVDSMPLAQATVSQHLKVLQETGWIEGEIDGPRVCYCPTAGAMTRFKELLKGLDTGERRS